MSSIISGRGGAGGRRSASGRGGSIRGSTNSDTQNDNGRNQQSNTAQSKPSGGRGRGKTHNQQRRNRKKPVTIRVFTSAFASLHDECQAARYKVHRPGCECSNLKEILSSNALVFVNRDQKDGHSEECSTPELPVNGLVVLPQIRSIRSMYLCWNTHQATYEANPRQSEVKMQKELFQDTQKDFKVSCAACLLDRQPNGFACVSSTSREAVDAARDLARAAAEEKESRHADHAHFTATLPRSALWQLFRSKTRNQTQQAQDKLSQDLANQGIPILPETNDIVLGHHLTSLLYLTKSDEDMYWLVLVYDDTEKTAKPRWTLDLPGGKRHLGETALEAAIRETEEETSLVWGRRWIRDERQSQRRSDRGNRYFLLTPPPIP